MTIDRKQDDMHNPNIDTAGIPFSTDDEGTDYPQHARQLVYEWIVGAGFHENHPTFSIDEVYVVWFTYTLGNWKAMLSTSLPDGRYYEVTHKRENDGSDGGAATFIDTYVKTHNVSVP